MKLLYILGVLLLFGAAFCEEETPEEPSDEVADQPEDETEEQADEVADEDEESDEDEEPEDEEADEEDDDESDVEDHQYKNRCRRKKVCSRRKQCVPKYFYVKASRRVRYCFNKLLHKYKKVCKTFCWHEQGYGHGKYYKKGRRVCKKRCYKVPKTKKVCRYRKIHFPQWRFKNVCKIVKDCYTIPIGKCGRRHHKY